MMLHYKFDKNWRSILDGTAFMMWKFGNFEIKEIFKFHWGWCTLKVKIFLGSKGCMINGWHRIDWAILEFCDRASWNRIQNIFDPFKSQYKHFDVPQEMVYFYYFKTRIK